MRLPDFNDTKADNQEWVGVYYPTEGIDEPRTKALLCLIFDKVICHFTSTGMACGGSSGAIDFFSDEVRSNPLLVATEFTEKFYN